MNWFQILAVLLVVGFVASLVVARTVSQRWRVTVFFLPFAAAALYVGTRPTGYDRWDTFTALAFSISALAGWLAGFGVVALNRRLRMQR